LRPPGCRRRRIACATTRPWPPAGRRATGARNRPCRSPRPGRARRPGGGGPRQRGNHARHDPQPARRGLVQDHARFAIQRRRRLERFEQLPERRKVQRRKNARHHETLRVAQARQELVVVAESVPRELAAVGRRRAAGQVTGKRPPAEGGAGRVIRSRAGSKGGGCPLRGQRGQDAPGGRLAKKPPPLDGLSVHVQFYFFRGLGALRVAGATLSAARLCR
jgi:hypothetical protein